MKKLLLIVLIVLIAGCSRPIEETDLVERDGLKYLPDRESPYSGRTVSRYENGQEKEDGNYRDGLREGPFVKWYANGQKMEEAAYINGKIDGLHTFLSLIHI